MPMMARMRSLAPAFIITVGVLFVLFMIISDSNVLEIFGARTNNIGSVNGEDISYQNFSNFLDNAIENQKAQTGQDIDEEQMDQFRDQVWEAIVTQILTEQQIKKFGITVTNDEIRAVIVSDNPPDFLKQNFIDSTGRFNKEVYQQAIFNPQNKEALVQAEEIVRQQILNQKLQSILFSSINVNDEEIRRRYIDQNIRMTAEFVLVDINSIPDSLIAVNDDELKQYYKEHPDEFEIKAQRKLKYVFFNFEPSRSDSQAIYQNLQNVLQRAKIDTSFKSLVEIYSEQPYLKDTVSVVSLSPEAFDQLDKANVGDITNPFLENDGYAIYKLLGKNNSSETFVRASHILIPSQGDDKKVLDEANRIYNEIKNGGKFEELAKKYSADPGSATKGGDLGWFGKGRMVKEFEDACFNGKINEVQKPVKTSYGYHIIKVTGKTNQKFIVEKIFNSIKPSASTKDMLYNRANDFAYLAEKNGFENEAKLAKYEIMVSAPFDEEAQAIPGMGYSKELVKFAFDNGLNTISPVYKVSGGYVVAKVEEIINAGVKPFEDVKQTVLFKVRNQKKLERSKTIIQNIKSKVGNNLADAKKVYDKARYDTTGAFTTAGNIPKVGVEYNFSAKALNLPLNKISDPIKGNRGYYLVRVLSRTNFDENNFAQQKDQIQNSILQEKKQRYFEQWLANLKKNSKIVDRRSMFFGR
ncbi:MAG: peptidylprolyl isomerase [Ignavibacterium sp.]